MPIGTNFENSAMKTSFSLSSLSASAGSEGPEHAKMRTERPYNSLTKKRKEPKQDYWRRSWGSSCETKDDFWSALQANYDYIMDNHLIDSCQDTEVDAHSKIDDTWNLNFFIIQFSELCTFLNNVEEAVYGKAENVTNWSLRAFHMEEMTRVSPRHRLFNEQANRIVDEAQILQDEVTWRVNHLNSKWKQVERALSSNRCSRCEHESCPDVEHEIKCLRKWVKEMESRLQPLNFQIKWTKPELEKKFLEHVVLHRDIENHNKIVNSVVRLCNRASNNPKDAKCYVSSTRRVASGLERRYHLLFLRSLEWQYHIESLFKIHNNHHQDYSSAADSDEEEPCVKQPRLSPNCRLYNRSGQLDDESVDGTGTSLSDTAMDMDVGSEHVNVIKMVNNGNERDRNDIELCGSTAGDRDNHNTATTKIEEKQQVGNSNCNSFGFPVGSCSNDKPHFSKDKNMLQKVIPVYNPSTTVTNIGSFIYEHRDTDSEMDIQKSVTLITSELEQKSKEESSEDEFTYLTSPPVSESKIKSTLEQTQHEENQPQSEPTSIISESLSQDSDANTHNSAVSSSSMKESIQDLVERAEELLLPRVDLFYNKQKSKLSQVTKWLNEENSCDASAESMSEELEDDRESQSSEDVNESIVTAYRPQNSQSLLANSTSNLYAEISPEMNKVNFRPKRSQMKDIRPRSVSCLSQLSQHASPVKLTSETLPNFSNSESALNNLQPSVGMHSFTASASANSIGIQGNNSTSSTLEESGAMCMNEGSKSGSARKKKTRTRRKSRKTESGSETQIYYKSLLNGTTTSLSPSSKSGSFSGTESKILNIERSTSNDLFHCRNDLSTTSGPDTEDDKKSFKYPKCLMESRYRVANGCSSNSKMEYRDSSPEKSSLNTAEEYSGSMSEQTWDNYLDKYLSENYSEAQDSEAARILSEFGEDYHNCFGNQSDCSLTHSNNYEFSPQFQRKLRLVPLSMSTSTSVADSDCESERIQQSIAESNNKLKYTRDIYEKNVSMNINEFLLSNDCVEILTNCERQIYRLGVIIDANVDTKALSAVEVREVQNLMSVWNNLKFSAKQLQSSKVIYNNIILLKNELLQYAVNPNPSSLELRSKEAFMTEINHLTEVQSVLQEKNRCLLELNHAVHRYTVNRDVPHCTDFTDLKSEVSELYNLWNDTNQSVNDRLNNLSTHLQVWAQLESRLDELQSDLRSDEETLQLLDTAIKAGVISMEVASSVRDVAKVLSESHTGTQKSMMSMEKSESATATSFLNRTLSLSLLTEGSFSDSGISDEGSEQELSEREHRLADIRRLVRQLEAIIAPDSEERIKLTQRLEQAENELRKLQSHCRGLIVRTAVCAEVQYRTVQTQNGINSLSKRRFSLDSLVSDYCDGRRRSRSRSCGCNRNRMRNRNETCCHKSDPDKDPDRDPDSDSSGSWFWRVMRASVPFQVALVALICMACLLEPSCCDSINNLHLSLAPQLRYVRGPPPV